MKPVVYIDGKEGTTGLEIYERLAGRSDIELLLIEEDRRKDAQRRSRLMNQADLVFLCLPDAAAKEAVGLVKNPKTRIIDASTAHRTHPDWAYGFPELSPGHRRRIEQALRVANPGCHASGFIAAAYPLVQQGIIAKDAPLAAYSLTGYSGGGKKMIAEYEAPDRDVRCKSDRIYATNLHHKHLPEMQAVCGLTQPPVFSPVVGDYFRGMATTLLLPGVSAAAAHEALARHYEGQALVTVAPPGGDEPVIYASTLAQKNSMRLIVCGHEGQTAVTALFDNLGKGACGAAVQNMNIMLGFAETEGLV